MGENRHENLGTYSRDGEGDNPLLTCGLRAARGPRSTDELGHGRSTTCAHIRRTSAPAYRIAWLWQCTGLLMWACRSPASAGAWTGLGRLDLLSRARSAYLQRVHLMPPEPPSAQHKVAGVGSRKTRVSIYSTANSAQHTFGQHTHMPNSFQVSFHERSHNCSSASTP